LCHGETHIIVVTVVASRQRKPLDDAVTSHSITFPIKEVYKAKGQGTRITGITRSASCFGHALASCCARRYPIVVSLLAVLLIFALAGFADPCLPYGQQVTIRGKLILRDENGYRQWITLNPERAICVVGQTKPVAELQVISTGGAQGPERLVGNAVVVRGKLFAAAPGVLIDVTDVQSVDPAALLKPEARDVTAYDVIIVAGERLTEEAREVGTNELLTPSEAYAPHWITESDVLFVSCRGGYEIESGNVEPPEHGLCPLDQMCGLAVQKKEVVTMRMRCRKKWPRSPGNPPPPVEPVPGG
jgi:hypothetical protein